MRMSRLLPRALAAALLGALPAGAADGTAPRPPNILLILADDLGYECIGANGCTSYKTPVLDRLAAGGVRFEHCYAQPLCTPSRAQIMTGIYNVRNYVRFGLLDPKQTTFAHLLRKAGYATCIAGKWQLEGGFEGPGHFGFDAYSLWQLTRRPGRYANPGLETDGREVDYEKGEYGPDLVCDYACAFMERNREKPFLVYFPMMLTHAPYDPTPDSAEWDPGRKGVKDEKGQARHFADLVGYMDKIVGRLEAKLAALGQRENTLILFTGDNGTGKGVVTRMGDREVKGGKGETTDAGTHVPLIAHWPAGIPGGRVCRDLVDFTDFLPTLCEAAGAAVPEALAIDGRSFLPQLRGEKGSPREWTYCWYARDGGPTAKEFARTHRYKLYRTGELYDVRDDVHEKAPLSGDLEAESAAAKALLQKALDRYRDARPEALKAPAKDTPKKKNT